MIPQPNHPPLHSWSITPFPLGQIRHEHLISPAEWPSDQTIYLSQIVTWHMIWFNVWKWKHILKITPSFILCLFLCLSNDMIIILLFFLLFHFNLSLITVIYVYILLLCIVIQKTKYVNLSSHCYNMNSYICICVSIMSVSDIWSGQFEWWGMVNSVFIYSLIFLIIIDASNIYSNIY